MTQSAERPPSLTEAQILELEGLLRRASPEPWRECGHDRGGCQCGLLWSVPQDFMLATFHEETDDGKLPREMMQANVALSAALRNLAPSLLSSLREARRLLWEALPYMERDALAASAGDQVHDLLDRVWAAFGERSDRERSSPTALKAEEKP